MSIQVRINLQDNIININVFLSFIIRYTLIVFRIFFRGQILFLPKAPFQDNADFKLTHLSMPATSMPSFSTNSLKGSS